jgi:hypothetical protein
MSQQPIRTYDKAVLTLQVEGEDDITITFERDAYGTGPVIVTRADDEGDHFHPDRLRYIRNLHIETIMPALKIEAGLITIRLPDPSEGEQP